MGIACIVLDSPLCCRIHKSNSCIGFPRRCQGDGCDQWSVVRGGVPRFECIHQLLYTLLLHCLGKHYRWCFWLESNFFSACASNPTRCSSLSAPSHQSLSWQAFRQWSRWWNPFSSTGICLRDPLGSCRSYFFAVLRSRLGRSLLAGIFIVHLC